MTLLLLDKSAYVRGAPTAGEEDELCLCAITRLELLYSARSPADYQQLETDLAEFRDLRMNAETFDIALGAQRELADRGRHRVSIPDLLIAACAQQHGADVLHVDRHFDALASVLSFTLRRADAPDGSAEA
ncbi:PIN domain-containing protein [Solirubrobacter soli]|uniref:PIN domain-containing protein n=1 Tax=Solirubrobacter soli TaxID=363832 RepID=UPI00040E7F1C|nr:PIN domain-containing protein [Solirubrobacter soli]